MAAWNQKLLSWYRRHQRILPWRRNPRPYHVWVSEIMLQQTQVETVRPYFRRFIKRFPSIKALAEADLQDVMKAWEGLGYYARARNLHHAARIIRREHAGRMPRHYDELQLLPGIGPYIAAAIASIAFHEPVPVVDGNVLRVFTRFWAIADDIRRPATRRDIFERLKPHVSDVDPSEFNQAIMELGALICRPQKPLCPQCPLQRNCRARRSRQVHCYPVKSPARAVPHYNIAVGIIHKRGRILIGRRRTDQMLGGLWEFPGGKQKRGETLEQTARREIGEETGLIVRIVNKCIVVNHAYSHFKITLTAFHCRVVSGKLANHANDELKWVRADDLDCYPFPAANKKIIEAILLEKRGQK